MLQKEKRESKKREIQAEITRIEQRLRDEKTRRKKSELEKGWKVGWGWGWGWVWGWGGLKKLG